MDGLAPAEAGAFCSGPESRDASVCWSFDDPAVPFGPLIESRRDDAGSLVVSLDRPFSPPGAMLTSLFAGGARTLAYTSARYGNRPLRSARCVLRVLIEESAPGEVSFLVTKHSGFPTTALGFLVRDTPSVISLVATIGFTRVEVPGVPLGMWQRIDVRAETDATTLRYAVATDRGTPIDSSGDAAVSGDLGTPDFELGLEGTAGWKVRFDDLACWVETK